MIAFSALSACSQGSELTESQTPIKTIKAPDKIESQGGVKSIQPLLDKMHAEAKKKSDLYKEYWKSDFFTDPITRMNLEFFDVDGSAIDAFSEDNHFYGKPIKSFIDPNLDNFLNKTYKTNTDSNHHLNLKIIPYVLRQDSSNQLYHLIPLDSPDRENVDFWFYKMDKFPDEVDANFPCAENAKCVFNRHLRADFNDTFKTYAKLQKKTDTSPIEAICYVRVATHDLEHNTEAKFRSVNSYKFHLNNCLMHFAQLLPLAG